MADAQTHAVHEMSVAAQRNILITGASSGIGAALARRYAAARTTLLLWGRNEQRLRSVAEECRAVGAATDTDAFDLHDIDTFLSRLAATDDAHPVSLAIFSAGMGGSIPRQAVAENARHTALMAEVNFTVPVAGAMFLAGRMAGRGGGQIVLIGSMAGVFPLPMAPTYSGTKAGLALFAQALRLRMRRYDVAVTLVSPGFVDTPMSQGLAEPKPFLISAETAAAIIARRLTRRPRHIVLPWQFAVINAVSRLMPRALIDAVLSRA